MSPKLAARPAFVIASLAFLVIVLSWRELLQVDLDERIAESTLREERLQRLRRIVATPLPVTERLRLETRLERLQKLSWSRAVSLHTLLEVGNLARANDTVLIDYWESHGRVELRSVSSSGAALGGFMRGINAAGLRDGSLCFTKCPNSEAADELGLYPARTWFNVAEGGIDADLARVADLIDRPSPDFWVGEGLFGPSVLDM
ncbi:MAG: hypothetical protein Q8O67_22520 [Deltaproteobacteria bacterium]|nr:hypothetical protein [Deltaproteobacteria bacterium]